MTDGRSSAEGETPATQPVERDDDEPEIGGRVATLRSRVRFGKFVSVGVVGAICDAAVLLALTAGLGVQPELATLIGIETAILVMFGINEHWTFADQGDTGVRALLGRLVRSHAVRAAGSVTQFLVFVTILWNLTVPLEVAGADLWILVPKGVGIAVGMVVNYVFESLFTWEVHRERLR